MSSGRSDGERDAERGAAPAESISVKQELLSFGPSFVSAALAFISGAGECSLEIKSEQQLQVLELVVDRATSEARRLRRGSGISGCQWVEELQRAGGDGGGGRLEDVLVAAFQLAASQLNRLGELAPDPGAQQRLMRRCKQVVDALWTAGARWPTNQRLYWRELLCRRWDKVAASLALEMLLLRAQLDCTSCKATLTRAGEAQEILQVIAFAYAQLPTALKEFCLDQVGGLIGTLVDEGPSYAFTPRMALQLHLLDNLAAVHFLDNSNNLDVTAWIGEYFAECFECCGVVLQLLGDERAEDCIGMTRMLDMCLLVLKVGFNYFETTRRRHDIITLLWILSPTIVAALPQLATRFIICAEANACTFAEAFEARPIETSLYLLARMGDVIGDDECDALTKVFEKLLAPSVASGCNAVRPTLISACFDVVHQLLAHSNSAEVMGPPLTALLQADGVEDLHIQYMRTIQARSSSETVKTALLFHDEVDTSGGNQKTVAGLPSDMDTDDADQQSVEDRIDVDEAVSDQPPAARLDVPQWFDDEDSADEDNELEAGMPLQVGGTEHESSQGNYINADSTMPQWFDEEEEEQLDIELPQCAFEDSNRQLCALLAPATLHALESAVCASNRVVDVDVASDDGSTSTDIVCWSDCSRRSSERSRSSPLASLPS